MKLGLLTCDSHRNLVAADQKLAILLREKSIDVLPVVWDDKNVQWTDYDALIFRTTWDYFEKEDSFMDWLFYISKLNIKIFNAIELVLQNVHKFYLRDLEAKDVKIIPTVFIEKTPFLNLSEHIPKTWENVIIKPAFSAASYLTTLFNISDINEINYKYQSIAQRKDLLVQKFIPEVLSNGECSFLFFNGCFSHAVRKIPKEGDFRVQSQFGGRYTSFFPEASIIAQAKRVIDCQTVLPLYARVDGIVIEDVLYLMELEMIEPDLYLDHHEAGYMTFVNAICERLL